MKGNFLDKFLGISTFGESHGKAIGILIEDIKPGIDFPFNEIRKALERRSTGKSEFSSSRQEKDELVVLSGIFNGKTTGLPICCIVYNHDQKSKDYSELKNVFRPGHADYSYFKKFKIYDYRGGGRASGRETLSRVIAGSLTNSILEKTTIEINTIQIGKLRAEKKDPTFSKKNPFHWPDKENYIQLENYLKQIKSEQDSIGGILEIKIKNVRSGLGDPVFEKMDANLAKAVFSIGAVKGIEFGNGFELAKLKGSQANDAMDENGFKTNNSGGISGGISTGEEIFCRIVVKPTPSIGKAQKTIDSSNNPREIKIQGRHDTVIIPRIIPVIEAMIKLVIADAMSYQNLVESNPQNLDQMREKIDKIDEDILLGIYRRNQISKQIGKLKKENKLKITDEDRERALFEDLRKKAELLDIDLETVEKIWQHIIAQSRKIQC